MQVLIVSETQGATPEEKDLLYFLAQHGVAHSLVTKECSPYEQAFVNLFKNKEENADAPDIQNQFKGLMDAIEEIEAAVEAEEVKEEEALDFDSTFKDFKGLFDAFKEVIAEEKEEDTTLPDIDYEDHECFDDGDYTECLRCEDREDCYSEYTLRFLLRDAVAADLTAHYNMPGLVRMYYNDIKYDLSGYPMISCPQHPFARPDGYIHRHRLVMESILRVTDAQEYLVTIPGVEGGPYLPRIVPIEHINGDIYDYSPENLEIIDNGDLTVNSVQILREELQAGLKGDS